MKFKGVNRSSITYNWMKSYIVIVVICLAFTSVLFGVVRNKFKEENEEFNNYVFAGVNSNVKDILVNMRKTYFDVQNSDYLSGMLNVSDKSQYRVDINTNKFVNEMINRAMYKSSIDFYYVYIPSTDTVIFEGGVLNSKFFHHVYILGEDYDSWILRLKNVQGGKCYTSRIKGNTSDYDAVSYDFVLNDRKHDSGENDKAVICLNINMERFFERFEKLSWVNNSDLYLFDREGNKILSTTPLSQNNENMNFDQFMNINDDKIRTASAVEFDTVQIKVAMAMHKKLLYRGMENIQIIFAIMILCMLISVGTIVPVLIRNNYRPLNEIMKRIDNGSSKNEYDAINEKIESMVSDNKKLMNISQRQNERIRLGDLGKLIKGKYSEEAAKSMLEKYNINFMYDNFYIYLFTVDGFDSMIGYEDVSDNDKFYELCFIIRNITEELLNTDETIAFVTEIDDTVAAIVNTSDMHADQIEKKLDFELNFLIEKYKVFISYTASEEHFGLSGISVAYQEALKTQEYKEAFSATDNIHYADISREDGSYEYYFGIKEEQKLMSSLRTGDYTECEKLLRHIYTRLNKNGDITIDMAKCTMFDILATLMKMPDGEGLDTSEKKEAFSKIFNNSNNMERMLECMLETIKKLCDRYKNRCSTNKVSDMVDFINENYTSQSLCTALVAEKFDMNDMYLLRLFKSEQKISLSDYINNLRINKAKELIVDTNMPISTISESVGFVSIRTMNRLFKKAENITPLQYRELYGRTETDE